MFFPKRKINFWIERYLRRRKLVALEKRRFTELGLAERKLNFLYAFLEASGLMVSPDCEKVLRAIKLSSSQKFQDVFALSANAFKRDGYFVEFGALDGVMHSNTYMLESHMNWRGILAEPARIWHEDLRKNRPNAHIETDCVHTVSGRSFDFNETPAGYSALADYKSAKELEAKGVSVKTYAVRTVSLNDLLERHSAPSDIDYLSIDTEGSEYDILSQLDFTRYKIKAITVEHNKDKAYQKRLFELLTSKGYVRKYAKLSREDDWYVFAC